MKCELMFTLRTAWFTCGVLAISALAASANQLQPPFRLPPPPFQTAAQTLAASQYWRTHSIGMAHPERQTPAEAAASRYWQTHPTHGHQGQPGFIPRYDPTPMGLERRDLVQPNSPCPQLIGTPNPQQICCKNGICNDIPDVVVYTDCLGTVSCVWADDGSGNHPYGRGGQCTGDAGGCFVGVHKGAPSGNCDKDSMAVGDTVGLVGGKPRTIVDINEIFQADGLPMNSNGTISVSSHVWGFIYKDNANQYWVQIDPAYQWTVSWSASVNAWGMSFGVSLNPPTGSPPRGPLNTSPKAPSGQLHVQCFTQGNLWN